MMRNVEKTLISHVRITRTVRDIKTVREGMDSKVIKGIITVRNSGLLIIVSKTM